MYKVYYWNAIYKIGEDVLIVGAESKEEARSIIDAQLSKHNFNGGIQDIRIFEEIPKVQASEKGILEVH